MTRSRSGLCGSFPSIGNYLKVTRMRAPSTFRIRHLFEWREEMGKFDSTDYSVPLRKIPTVDMASANDRRSCIDATREHDNINKERSLPFPCRGILFHPNSCSLHVRTDQDTSSIRPWTTTLSGRGLESGRNCSSASNTSDVLDEGKCLLFYTCLSESSSRKIDQHDQYLANQSVESIDYLYRWQWVSKFVFGKTPSKRFLRWFSSTCICWLLHSISETGRCHRMSFLSFSRITIVYSLIERLTADGRFSFLKTSLWMTLSRIRPCSSRRSTNYRNIHRRSVYSSTEIRFS
jgi:hypothetical protein